MEGKTADEQHLQVCVTMVGVMVSYADSYCRYHHICGVKLPFCSHVSIYSDLYDHPLVSCKGRCMLIKIFFLKLLIMIWLFFQCGSPAGMAQLINYFDLQSRRLDKQSYHHAPFNSDFESLIKFNGVPILPPAVRRHFTVILFKFYVMLPHLINKITKLIFFLSI